MECVALDVERLHLGLADFDTPFVGGGVERAFDLQADLGGGRRNQLDPPPDVPIKIQDHSRRHSSYSAILLSTAGSKRWISILMADDRNSDFVANAANSLSGQGKIAAQQIRHGTAGTAGSKFQPGRCAGSKENSRGEMDSSCT